MYNAVNMLILTTATHCSQLVTFWLDFLCAILLENKYIQKIDTALMHANNHWVKLRMRFFCKSFQIY